MDESGKALLTNRLRTSNSERANQYLPTLAPFNVESAGSGFEVSNPATNSESEPARYRALFALNLAVTFVSPVSNALVHPH